MSDREKELTEGRRTNGIEAEVEGEDTLPYNLCKYILAPNVGRE